MNDEDDGWIRDYLLVAQYLFINRDRKPNQTKPNQTTEIINATIHAPEIETTTVGTSIGIYYQLDQHHVYPKLSTRPPVRPFGL